MKDNELEGYLNRRRGTVCLMKWEQPLRKRKETVQRRITVSVEVWSRHRSWEQSRA